MLATSAPSQWFGGTGAWRVGRTGPETADDRRAIFEAALDGMLVASVCPATGNALAVEMYAQRGPGRALSMLRLPAGATLVLFSDGLVQRRTTGRSVPRPC